MSSQLPYTIAFCLVQDKVLMVKRAKPPNLNLWNGIGGKIEADEQPLEAIAREIMEEAQLDINKALNVHFAGTVTWTIVEDEMNKNKGMYAYLIEFDPSDMALKSTDTPEGLLHWQDLSWAIDKSNAEVVKNIPHFLPEMLKKQDPFNYHCVYLNGDFDHITTEEM